MQLALFQRTAFADIGCHSNDDRIAASSSCAYLFTLVPKQYRDFVDVFLQAFDFGGRCGRTDHGMAVRAQAFRERTSDVAETENQ